MARKLTGVLPIVQTPFCDDDTIDRPTLQREIDWAYSVGADGVGVAMVSELLRLTADERIALTRDVVELSDGRGVVFASVGAESTRQAQVFAVAAQQAGCDAIMAAPPATTPCGEAAIVEYFCALADEVDLPLIVQDASSYLGQQIPLRVYVRLLERYGQDKILFKPEANPIGPNLSALREASGGLARIFEGSGGIHLVDSYRRGIVGTMPGMDLLDGMVELWKALERHDEERIYQLSLPIAAIVGLQIQGGLDGFLAIEKYLLQRRGIFVNTRRRKPYSWELDAETAQEVDRLFARFTDAVNQYLSS